MSNSTFATRFYSYNNSYAIKLQTVKLQAAAFWLRQNGCIFSTYSDRSTGLTKIYLKTVPINVVEALVKKHGFFNAKAQAPKTTKTAPVPTTSRPVPVGQLSREEWLARFRSPAATQAVAQPKGRAIRNADELPKNAVALKPIAVVVPQLCVEPNCYNKVKQNGVWVVTSTYVCQTVQLETEGYIKAIAFTDKEAHIAANRRQTNSQVAKPFQNASAQQSIMDTACTPITKLTNSQLRVECQRRGIQLGSGWTRNHVLVAHLRSLGVTEV